MGIDVQVVPRCFVPKAAFFCKRASPIPDKADVETDVRQLRRRCQGEGVPLEPGHFRAVQEGVLSGLCRHFRDLDFHHFHFVVVHDNTLDLHRSCLALVEPVDAFEQVERERTLGSTP